MQNIKRKWEIFGSWYQEDGSKKSVEIYGIVFIMSGHKWTKFYVASPIFAKLSSFTSGFHSRAESWLRQNHSSDLELGLSDVDMYDECDDNFSPKFIKNVTQKCALSNIHMLAIMEEIDDFCM